MAKLQRRLGGAAGEAGKEASAPSPPAVSVAEGTCPAHPTAAASRRLGPWRAQREAACRPLRPRWPHLHRGWGQPPCPSKPSWSFAGSSPRPRGTPGRLRRSRQERSRQAAQGDLCSHNSTDGLRVSTGHSGPGFLPDEPVVNTKLFMGNSRRTQIPGTFANQRESSLWHVHRATFYRTHV